MYKAVKNADFPVIQDKGCLDSNFLVRVNNRHEASLKKMYLPKGEDSGKLHNAKFAQKMQN